MRRWRRWSWSICCRRFDSKGDAVPLRYAPGSGETGGDNPLSSARRTRPRRHGAGRGVKVRYTPRLLRGILCGALRCACPACSDFVGMRQEIAPLLGRFPFARRAANFFPGCSRRAGCPHPAVPSVGGDFSGLLPQGGTLQSGFSCGFTAIHLLTSSRRPTNLQTLSGTGKGTPLACLALPYINV